MQMCRQVHRKQVFMTCQDAGGCMQMCRQVHRKQVFMIALIVLHRPEAVIVSPTGACRRCIGGALITCGHNGHAGAGVQAMRPIMKGCVVQCVFEFLRGRMWH